MRAYEQCLKTYLGRTNVKSAEAVFFFHRICFDQNSLLELDIGIFYFFSVWLFHSSIGFGEIA